MSDKSSTVLVVDDSASDLQITMSAIRADFKVTAAKNGEQAIVMMDKIKADVILLDVNMPEMDGYETCQRMKEKNSEVDIVFVSSNDSTEEILKGFDLGASDYVVKPISPEILLNKVKRLIEDKSQKRAMQQEIEMASKVAMTAMSSSGELGVILDFLRNGFKSKSIEELANHIKLSLMRFGIQGAFQLRLAEQKYYFSTLGNVPPIEKELLSRIALMNQRFIEKGQRLFLNNGNVSLLIKNLPTEDDEKAGRLRDYLAILAEGSTEKVDTIMQQMQAATLRSESMTALIEEANDSLAYIYQTQQDIEKQNVALLDDLVSGVEGSFVGFELTGEQEDSILRLLNDAQEKSAALFNKNVALETELEAVVAKFRQFIN